MAGQITVSVELADGTKVETTRNWSGGNRTYEGAEAQHAGMIATNEVREMIDATHGSVGAQPASSMQSHRGRTAL